LKNEVFLAGALKELTERPIREVGAPVYTMMKAVEIALPLPKTEPEERKTVKVVEKIYDGGVEESDLPPIFYDKQIYSVEENLFNLV
jgi:hypothetical protein